MNDEQLRELMRSVDGPRPLPSALTARISRQVNERDDSSSSHVPSTVVEVTLSPMKGPAPSRRRSVAAICALALLGAVVVFLALGPERGSPLAVETVTPVHILIACVDFIDTTEKDGLPWVAVTIEMEARSVYTDRDLDYLAVLAEAIDVIASHPESAPARADLQEAARLARSGASVADIRTALLLATEIYEDMISTRCLDSRTRLGLNPD